MKESIKYWVWFGLKLVHASLLYIGLMTVVGLLDK